MDTRDNLQDLSKATEGLSLAERSTFESYFIGALSALVGSKDWNRGLETAKQAAEMLRPGMVGK